MDLLPTDGTSFIWGLLAGVAATFFSTFISRASNDAYTYLKNRLNPPTPEPILVESRFAKQYLDANTWAWIDDIYLYDYEMKGYTYFPHPKNQAKVFRKSTDGENTFIEYLMLKPETIAETIESD